MVPTCTRSEPTVALVAPTPSAVRNRCVVVHPRRDRPAAVDAIVSVATNMAPISQPLTIATGFALLAGRGLARHLF